MGNQDRVVEALQSSDLARALFVEAGDALFIVDPLSERVLDANPIAEKMSKRGRDDLAKLTVRDVVKHELGWDDWLQTVRQTSTFHGRDGYLLRSGSADVWTPVSLTISRLHLPGSQPLALLTFRDRSEQVDAYRRVQRTEAELRRVLVSVSDCLYSYRIDPKGQRRYRYLSPVVERLTGKPVSYFLDDPLRWGEVIDPQDQLRWREFLTGLMPRSTGEVEYRIRKTDGDLRWVRESVTTAVPEEGSGTLVHGILSDITERKQIDQLAEERRLMESHKLESLGVLSGSLAHDFNNLLTSILGNVSLARMALPAESGATPPLNEVETASLRAAEVCRHLLTFTGKGRVVMASVSANDVVQETLENMKPSMPRGITLQADLASSLPALLADASQLRQMLVNLIVNSTESLEDKGGVIRVKTMAAMLDRRTARKARYVAPDMIEGDAVAIEVRDAGPGMEPEVQARMFEPFFSTKFHGRGLGLAVVLGTVRSHKGAIMVESSPGHGTAMRILIPAALTRPRPSQFGPTAPATETAVKTVLVADDEEAVRMVTSRMLEASGFQVVQAIDGRDALDKFKQTADAVRLVLLDLTMPNLGGEDAFKLLRKMRPDLPVIVMSGYPEPDVMTRFIGAGLTAFLQKPFRPLDLVDLVRTHFPTAS